MRLECGGSGVRTVGASGARKRLDGHTWLHINNLSAWRTLTSDNHSKCRMPRDCHFRNIVRPVGIARCVQLLSVGRYHQARFRENRTYTATDAKHHAMRHAAKLYPAPERHVDDIASFARKGRCKRAVRRHHARHMDDKGRIRCRRFRERGHTRTAQHHRNNGPHQPHRSIVPMRRIFRCSCITP